MAKLLCITPWPGSRTHHGRIPAALIPRWQKHFDHLGVWSIHGGPEDGPLGFEPDQVWHGTQPLEERLPKLGQVITENEWTHIWVMGDLQFLQAVAGLGLVAENLPDTRLYAHAIIDSPFINSRYIRLPEFFDEFVVMSSMCRGALIETVSELGDKVSKKQVKAADRVRVISPGVDTQVFRPLDVRAGEPSYEEIRESMFGDRVNSQDLLVMVSGQKTRRKGLPQIFSTIKELQGLMKNGRRVRLYLHMYCRADEQRPIRLDVLAAGCGLDPVKDVLYGDGFFAQPNPSLPDEDLNLIYNAADLVLSADLKNGWCFATTEAMAAGTVVAAPDEHTWLGVIHGRGIELPCTQFDWSPWSASEYVRRIDPYAAALRIAQVVNDNQALARCRDSGLAWSRSARADWGRAASDWLELFGVA